MQFIVNFKENIMKKILSKIILGLAAVCLIGFSMLNSVAVNDSDKSEKTSGNKVIGIDKALENKNNIGCYVKTLVKIDENTQVDLYEIKSAYNKSCVKELSYTEFNSKNQKYYAGNISQLILDTKGHKRILWSKYSLFSVFPTVGDRNNFDYVPVYDIAINKDLTELRVIYQISTLVNVDYIDITKSSDSSGRTASIYRTASQEYDQSIKDARFITPGIVGIENKINSILYYQIIDNDTKRSNIMTDKLLWWNGKGSKGVMIANDKSISYYRDGDAPVYDGSVWTGWYKMGRDKLE